MPSWNRSHYSNSLHLIVCDTLGQSVWGHQCWIFSFSCHLWLMCAFSKTFLYCMQKRQQPFSTLELFETLSGNQHIAHVYTLHHSYTTCRIQFNDSENTFGLTVHLFRFSEVYADHPEKRRKRGSSLFFRKKKDKSKTKGQSTNCDGNIDHRQSQ